jgi:hypothetical protein
MTTHTAKPAEDKCREALLPCPFCDRQPILWNRDAILPWVIQCCGSMVSSDRNGLITTWNSRPAIDWSGMIEKLEAEKGFDPNDWCRGFNDGLGRAIAIIRKEIENG